MRIADLRGGTPHGVLLRTVVLCKIFPTENVPYRLEGDGVEGYRLDVRFAAPTEAGILTWFIAKRAVC